MKVFNCDDLMNFDESISDAYLAAFLIKEGNKMSISIKFYYGFNLYLLLLLINKLTYLLFKLSMFLYLSFN